MAKLADIAKVAANRSVLSAFGKAHGYKGTDFSKLLKTKSISSAYFKSKNLKSVPTRIAHMGKIKGLIGKKRLADLEKAIANRNRRMRRQTAKLTGRPYTYEDYVNLSRAGYLPPTIAIDLSKITSIKEYNELMRMLNADKTKSWKLQRREKMQNWLAESIRRSIAVDDDDDPELFDHIYNMSEGDILEFRENNKDLIKSIFHYYDAATIDIDDREDMWRRIRKALGMGEPPISDVLTV